MPHTFPATPALSSPRGSLLCCRRLDGPSVQPSLAPGLGPGRSRCHPRHPRRRGCGRVPPPAPCSGLRAGRSCSAGRRGGPCTPPSSSGRHPGHVAPRRAKPVPHPGARVPGARLERGPGGPGGARRRPLLQAHPARRPGAPRARGGGWRDPLALLAAGTGRRGPGPPLPCRPLREQAGGGGHAPGDPGLGRHPLLGLGGDPGGGTRHGARRLRRRRARLGRRLLPGRPGRGLAQAAGRALRRRRTVLEVRRRARHRVRGQGDRAQAALPLHRSRRRHRLLRRRRHQRPPRIPQGPGPLRAPHLALREPAPPAARLRARPSGRGLRRAGGNAGLGRGRRGGDAGGVEWRMRADRPGPPPERLRVGLLPPLPRERGRRGTGRAEAGGGAGGNDRPLHRTPPPLRHPAGRRLREPAPPPSPPGRAGEGGVARRLPGPHRRRASPESTAPRWR